MIYRVRCADDLDREVDAERMEVEGGFLKFLRGDFVVAVFSREHVIYALTA